MGATGVVGGNIPMALGSALAARLRGGDQVAVVFFGDGAVQAGNFNESVNLAALWELPVILVCENNGFAEFTPRSAHTKVERVSDVVAPYGLDARDGRRQRRASPCASASRGFLAAARAGRGPVAARVPDAPAARPLRGRPGALPRGARGRGLAGAGPDPALRSGAASTRAGWRGRGARRSSARRRGGRGRGRVRAREPVPAGAALRRRARVRVDDDHVPARRSPPRWREAMRADPSVFVLGEDVAEGGPYGATAGLADEFGAERVLQHADHRGARSAASAIGAAQSGHAAGASRSCSSTSSRSRSTSSSTRRRRRTRCPAAS